LLAFALVCSLSCGDSESSTPEEDSGTQRDAGRDAAVEPVACERNGDCDDGLYCNGEETCQANVCERGRAIECDDDIACTEDVCSETTRACRVVPPDRDGDGHFDVHCKDESGTAFGEDCDDLDTLRFPQNIEICDEAHHDEDCNPQTNGNRDQDGDEFFDSACCNSASDEPDAELICGEDCRGLRHLRQRLRRRDRRRRHRRPLPGPRLRSPRRQRRGGRELLPGQSGLRDRGRRLR
jgi:hypothetical protein